MFTTVLNFLARLWDGFIGVLQRIWDFGKSGWVWIVAVITGLIAITQHVSEFIYNAIVSAAEGLGTIVGSGNDIIGSGGGSGGSAAGQCMGTINCFFPLQESVTLLSSFVIIVSAGLLYRLIKSWIPTLS